ncbi:MAG TPA: MBL fold metallo-hydrolase [Candidatus Dormibacteraeota bacterium]|jgi:cyclase|nr:MBL fold metallo-hydrolase [Candidatus Dormibacteraeota bacterium]
MAPTPSSAHAAEGELKSLGNGIHAYLQPDWTWGLNNTGFVVGGGAVTVIDACFTVHRTEQFIRSIRNVTDRQMRTLVNTHHHGDHTFGNMLFPEATIVAHELCRSEVVRQQLSLLPLFPGVDWGELVVTPPAVTFEDRISLYVDELELQLIHVGPAHTPGDVVVWLPQQRILFTGDIVFKDTTPFVAEGSIAHFFETLQTLRDLQPDVVVPGHGPLCDAAAFDEVEEYLRFVDEVARDGFAADRSPLEQARHIELGRYEPWNDNERIVGNIARAYSELRGEPLGATLELREVVPQMVEYAGHPLRCIA